MLDLAPAILQLDQECDALTARIDATRPEATPVEFALLRAKSLGRSMLRRAAAIGVTSPRAFEAFYQGVRIRTVKETDDV